VNEVERATLPSAVHGLRAVATDSRGAAARLAASLSIGFALAAAAGGCWAQASAPLRLKSSQEIAPFRLTGINGYIVARYMIDENRTSGQGAVAGSRAQQSNLSEEIHLMTHSYIYHPTLLTLDLGGGPVLEQSNYGVDGVATNSKRQLYNFNGRATFLREKPYTGALFYDRRNQTQSMGPAEVMLTENTRYGASFSLLSPVTPVPLQIELSRSENQGKGAEQVIQDRIDQLRLTMDANVGALGKSILQYVGTRQDSVSGSANLPIQASSSQIDNVNLNTRLKLGPNSEYDLNNVITLNTNKYTAGQGALTELKDLRLGLDLRGRHSEALQTYGRYNFSDSRQGELAMTQNSAGAGVSYRLNPELSGTLAARGENNQSSQLSSTLYGIDGSASYQKALALGQATAGYSFAYTQREQQASAQQVRVVGERLTLAGTSLVLLRSEQIAAGSVVVSNATRTQIFVEGRDYVLSQIGLKLSVQRLIGGNILDAQEVLADYAYAAGGSYASTQLDNTVNLSWALKSYLNLFVRYLDSAPQLTSGTPTAPLNPVKSLVYGSRAELPLSLLTQEFVLGGRAEREDRRETISPYQRANLEAYVQMDLPLVRNGNIRLGTRRLQIDYDHNPAQGVKLVAYDLRLWSRLGYGIDLSVDASRERDTGTPLARERSYTSAKAQWRKRKLLWTFDLTRVQDAQGASVRTRTYGQILLRRDF